MPVLLGKFLGSASERAVKRFLPAVERINRLEPEYQQLSDSELRAKTDEFKARLEEGETLDDLLPEAFATVREASRRTIGLRHFDVQLIGGMVLHQGKIAEMRTGEGKTLVATLPVYLNALEGKGGHLVTVNDYLARRDLQWMGPIYHFLGLTAACLQHEASHQFDPEARSDDSAMNALRTVSRQEAYQADITYGTNHEFGFDHLRDNMAVEPAQVVQRTLHYAIVDEVDYILIDEARTPLIVSGPAQESTQTYGTIARLVPRLQAEEDYTVEEKQRAVSLTDQGISKMERWLNIENLYDESNFLLTHYIENALRSLAVYHKDRDYVVKDGQVIIVDEFTGRLMEGRRYGDGLHQAIEAKEGVKVQQESLTYATITLQNYFRMYQKLAGMTGTAATESEELMGIYGLNVVVVPTHQPMIRVDHPDYIFKTMQAKWRGAVEEIEECHKLGQPVLVGTTSIENSEKLSESLRRRGIPHEVLNAKNHEREAAIVAQAGARGAITVATNMAGRGTDIILGGNLEVLQIEELRKRGYTMDSAPPELLADVRQEVEGRWRREHDEVVGLGGLYVLGTEKHEARRIDNQLRGRSGRQGDPGSSRFYVALDDDLMRRFGGDRVQGLMERAGMEEDQPIEMNLVSKAIGWAQTRVEGHNFEIRKHLVQYDDVNNKHREVIYSERRKVLQGADLQANIWSMVEKELENLLAGRLNGVDPEGWDLEELEKELSAIFPLPPDLHRYDMERMGAEEIRNRVMEYAQSLYQQREESGDIEDMRRLERLIMLRSLDSHWVLHLTAMENLRQGVGLFAYGQRDPLVMYNTEAHQKFQQVLEDVQHDIVHTIFHATAMTQSGQAAPRQAMAARAARPSPMAAVVAGSARTGGAVGTKVGRNDTCPCGSGKKYKRCHGANA